MMTVSGKPRGNTNMISKTAQSWADISIEVLQQHSNAILFMEIMEIR